MADSYSGKNTLLYLLQKIKNKLNEKVDKVDGKGLSSNDFTDAYKESLIRADANIFSKKYSDLTGVPTKLTDFTNDAGYQTATDVNNAIAACGFIKPLVVTELPSSNDAKTDIIYYVPSGDDEDGNYYDEYMFVNGNFELVGTTKVDLDGYWNEENLIEIQNSEIDTIWNRVFTDDQ